MCRHRKKHPIDFPGRKHETDPNCRVDLVGATGRLRWCWRLIDTTFPAAIFDDGQAVRKRIDAGELLAFETAFLTHKPVVWLRLAFEADVEPAVGVPSNCRS